MSVYVQRCVCKGVGLSFQQSKTKPTFQNLKTTPTFLNEIFSNDSWGLGQNCGAISSSSVLSEFSFNLLEGIQSLTSLTHACNLEAVTSSGVLESNEK